MKNKNLSKRAVYSLVIIVLLFVTNSYNYSQEHNGHNLKSGIKSQVDSTIIQKGIINLKKIDKNKDGKVYQDPMDWNVISDSPGKCPLCKMVLKEVTLKTAKENLIKNGFKVK